MGWGNYKCNYLYTVLGKGVGYFRAGKDYLRKGIVLFGKSFDSIVHPGFVYSFEKMSKILVRNQRMMRIIALLLRPKQIQSNFLQKSMFLFLSGSLFSLIFSSFVYCLIHRTVFVEFVDAFYIGCIFSMFLAVYCSFAARKGIIRDLLVGIQIIVEKSNGKWQGCSTVLF